jgi:hypothetical protein
MCTVHPNSLSGGLSAWVVRRAELDHSVGRMARRELPPLMAAIFTGFTVPITTPQILWVNMVTPDALGPVIFFEQQRSTSCTGSRALMSDRYSMPWGMACHLFCWSHTARTTICAFFWTKSRGAYDELGRGVPVNALIIGRIFYL